MGASGPNPISRLAVIPMLPSSQGYIGTGGVEFMPRPRVFLPGAAPGLGPDVPSAGIGAQWAPGQGGDTPGGGGGSMIGMEVAVPSDWFVNGLVVTPVQIPQPGTVGYMGARRGGA